VRDLPNVAVMIRRGNLGGDGRGGGLSNELEESLDLGVGQNAERRTGAHWVIGKEIHRHTLLANLPGGRYPHPHQHTPERSSKLGK